MEKDKLLELLIEISKGVCDNYPQRWGDCYKVNSTVAYFINRHMKEVVAKIWQVVVDTEDRIYDDEEVGYTNEVYHVMLTFNYNDDEYYPEFDDLVDFSNVFVGKRETSYYDGKVVDDLNGQENKKLMKLLENKYKEEIQKMKNLTLSV